MRSGGHALVGRGAARSAPMRSASGPPLDGGRLSAVLSARLTRRGVEGARRIGAIHQGRPLGRRGRDLADELDNHRRGHPRGRSGPGEDRAVPRAPSPSCRRSRNSGNDPGPSMTGDPGEQTILEHLARPAGTLGAHRLKPKRMAIRDCRRRQRFPGRCLDRSIPQSTPRWTAIGALRDLRRRAPACRRPAASLQLHLRDRA